MPLSPGQILRDRYRLDGLLAQGGMGAVYHGWDLNLSVRCAIKENQLVTEAARRQFEREARLLARLRHPNLPRVTDHFLIAGQGQYLVMDFIEGEDLHQRLQRSGPLPEADVRRWADDVLNALIYLHRRGVVHRDLKPHNVKIAADGSAVLVDFGIAKEIESGAVTSTGARGLTPGFAPPEQYGVGSRRTDGRSDVYALGATLYALLTGEAPADALTRLAKPEAFVPLARRAANWSSPLVQAVDKALAMEPGERFADAEEMRRALRVGRMDSTAQSGRLGIARPTARPSPRRSLWIGAALAAVFSAVCLIAAALIAWGSIERDRAAGAARAQATASSQATAAAAALDATERVRAQWPIILADAFTSNANGWVTRSFDDNFASGSWLIADGKYRWVVQAKQPSIYSWAWLDKNAVSSFRASVEAKRASGAADGLYGLAFRAVDQNNFYFFAISDTGGFIFKIVNNAMWREIIGWTSTAAIRPGEPNVLTVSAEDGHFILSINNQYVGQAEDNRLSRGYVGIATQLQFAGDEAVFEFDDLEVSAP